MKPEALEDAPKYREWRRATAAHGLHVGHTEPLELIHKPNGELLFALLKADMHDAEGQPLPPVLLLRGHFVAIVVAITEAETGTEKLLLVRQTRVADGSVLYEHPAGMLDREADPRTVAIRELQEETGLTVTREQLVPLNEEPIFTSPGLLDEGGYLYYVRLTLPAAEMADLQDRQLGEPGEQEYIRLHLATAEETLRLSRNMTTLYATCAYLRARGS